MKFKFSVAPNYHHPVDTKQIMRDLMIALVGVSIFSVFLQCSLYGIEGAVRAISIFAVAIFAGYLTNYIYWKVRKTKKEDMKFKIEESVPAVTAIILALTMPLGDLGSYMILYITFIAVVVAELFGKLLYGGFGYNIFNPAAVGRAFVLIAFGSYLVIPQIDGLASATTLTTLSQEDGFLRIHETFKGYSSLLIGTHQGALGETMGIPILLAGAYLVFKNVIDWVLPVFSVATVAVLAAVSTLFTGGFNLDYIIIQILSGGLLFGAIFMLTDPVTNPTSRQGKIIYAIVFGLITFLIREKASLPEGVVFALLIVNLIVPTIDRFTSNVTNVDTNKKLVSILITAAIAIVMTILFQFV